jgi:hypothetical protein
VTHWFASVLKRSWDARWLQPIARVGALGDIEHKLEPNAQRTSATARFKAESSDQVYLYVNDAILLIPMMTTVFYNNNRGTANVSICEVVDDGGSAHSDISGCKPATSTTTVNP